MKRFIFLSALFLLTGCAALLPKQEPSRIFTLNAMPAPPANSIKLANSLQILVPQASPGLETQRIALREGNNQINYFGHAQWAAPLHQMVQSTLVEYFDASGQFKSVTNDLSSTSADDHILVELRDFQVEYRNKAPFAHVRIAASLIDASTNIVLQTFHYDEMEAAKTNTMADVIPAFDTAWQRIANQLVADAATTLTSVQRPEKTLTDSPHKPLNKK